MVRCGLIEPREAYHADGPGGRPLDRCPARERRGSKADAEELLTHEQHVARANIRLGDPDEGAVRAAQIGEKELRAVPREATVQARDVSVLGEEDVPALATEVDATLRDG